MRATEIANAVKPYVIRMINDAGYTKFGAGGRVGRIPGGYIVTSQFVPAIGGTISGASSTFLTPGGGPWVSGSSITRFDDYGEVGISMNSSPYNFFGYGIFRMPTGVTSFTMTMVYRMERSGSSGTYGSIEVSHTFQDVQSSGSLGSAAWSDSGLISIASATNPRHVIATNSAITTTAGSSGLVTPGNYIMLEAEYVSTSGFDGYAWFLGCLVDFS